MSAGLRPLCLKSQVPERVLASNPTMSNVCIGSDRVVVLVMVVSDSSSISSSSSSNSNNSSSTSSNSNSSSSSTTTTTTTRSTHTHLRAGSECRPEAFVAGQVAKWTVC